MSLVNGAWAAYIALVALNRVYHCPEGGCPSSMFAYVPFAQGQAVVGGLLVMVALVSFTGRRPAFVIGAVLSAAVLVTVALTWSTYTTNESITAAALSTIALIVDAVASMSVRDVSEQTNPMNLPVFG